MTCKGKITYIRIRWLVLRSSQSKSFQRFLVRSCQIELMRSNNFVVTVPGKKCSEVEAQANNYENKASVWTNFKNSFAWLTGMKKLIFYYNNFFGSGSFFYPWYVRNRPKNDRNQKVIGWKNLCFYACGPHERICKICSQP